MARTCGLVPSERGGIALEELDAPVALSIYTVLWGYIKGVDYLLHDRVAQLKWPPTIATGVVTLRLEDVGEIKASLLAVW